MDTKIGPTARRTGLLTALIARLPPFPISDPRAYLAKPGGGRKLAEEINKYIAREGGLAFEDSALRRALLQLHFRAAMARTETERERERGYLTLALKPFLRPPLMYPGRPPRANAPELRRAYRLLVHHLLALLDDHTDLSRYPVARLLREQREWSTKEILPRLDRGNVRLAALLVLAKLSGLSPRQLRRYLRGDGP